MDNVKVLGINRRHLLGSMFIATAALAAPAAICRAAGRPAEAFRGIRYATADRFGPAELLPFTDNLIQKERGPVAPQLPSRVALSLGAQAPLRQDEQCHVLSVFTPSRQGRRPVMVFIHGGASVTGGGELPWYDGDQLAREQDVVVVTVTYRLGALGFWRPDNSDGMSPASTDHLTALEWVQANIDRFGGDPSNVTLVGQSAGANAAMALQGWGHGGTLFKRIIHMSSYRATGTRALAEEASRQFDTALGEDPRSASVEALLAAQARLGTSRPEGFWRMIHSDNPAKPNVDLMAGWTSEELSAHMLLAESNRPQPGTSLERFRAGTVRLAGDSQALARGFAAAGKNAYGYSFDWNGPDTGLGNCHCIDLTFLFGGREAWGAAPMLGGVDWADHDRLGRSMRAQWAAFASDGDPGARGGRPWIKATGTTASAQSLR